MHHSNILDHRKQLLGDIKSGKSVSRKELEEKYNYWLDIQNEWLEKDKQESTDLTITLVFEYGCRQATYRMALELLDKLSEECPAVKIIQEQDETGQYKFEF